MNILIKFKKIILETCVLRELIHYRKGLTAQDLDNPGINKTPPDVLSDLKIDYYARLPIELINMLDGGIKQVASEETSCLIARHKTETVGCILFNLNGKAKLMRPFRQEFIFNNGAYLYGLFVKKDFRGNGIAKLLYQHSFEMLKDKFNYAHILVDSENLAPNKIARQLGFSLMKKLALIKIFGLRITFNLNNPFKNIFYRGISILVKLFLVAVRLTFWILRLGREWIEEGRYRFLIKLYHAYILDQTNSVKIAFFCKDKPDKALLNRIYPGAKYEIKHIKTFLKQKIKTEFDAASKNMDVAIAEYKFDYLYKKLARLEGVKFMPEFIAQKTEGIYALSEFRKRTNRRAYEDIRTTKKYKYTCEFTNDNRQLLSFFYENMYLPYISKRYNGEEIISPFNLIKRSFKKGGLLLIKDGNKYLSGSVIELNDGVFRPKFIGILNGDIRLLKKDALSSLYYFYFKFASENGFKTIDLGLSRALLNDGVLRYKTKWKTKIEFDKKRSNVFALRIFNLTEPLKYFLVNNPFISVENNNLISNIYLNSEGIFNEEEVNKKYRLNGISGLKIIHLNGNKNVDSDLKIHNLSPAVV